MFNLINLIRNVVDAFSIGGKIMELPLGFPKMHAIGKQLLLVGCLMFIASCTPEPVQSVLDSIDNSVAAFERSIAAGEESVDEVISALEETRDVLIEEGQSTLANEVERLIGASIAKAGNQFMCGVDFLGARGIQTLQSIKDAILNNEDSIAQSMPVICIIEPVSIDLNLPPERRTEIRFWGYDLDHLDSSGNGFRLSLVSEDNEVEDQSDHISLATHYAGVINTSGNGVQFASNSDQLVLTWGQDSGFKDSEIAVLRPKPPETRVVSVSPQSSFQYIPPKTAGDAEFDGKVDIVSSATLVIVPNNEQVLALEIEMIAQEDGGTTVARGTSNIKTAQYEVYRAPDGFVIDRIISAPFDRIAYTDTNHEMDCFSPEQLDEANELFERIGHVGFPRSKYTNNGLVDRWCFVGDTEGHEAGTQTRVTIRLHDIQVRIIEDR